jgi:Protein of unknown function (DUF3455)
MKHVNVNRLLLVALAAAVAAMSFGHVAQAGPAEPSVPATIVVPEGHKLFLVAHAVGVQIHTCTATPDGYRWRFDGPRADLYDDHGKLVGTHFAGPSWQARDGSRIRAALDADPVPVDPTAIPWLRLRVTFATPGADGDRLAATTFIQRIATTGGLAPASADCNEGSAGTTEEVPYTADYAFWKEK